MKRTSGVLMHVSSLWGDYSAGAIGTAARQWIDFLADCGFGVWQVLPFCLPDDCNSPYKSNGAFSVNPYLIDLPELHRRGLLTREELESARQTEPYCCEFARLNAERMALLSKAASRVGAAEKKQIAAFLAAHPQVEQFCRFMALKEANGGAEWVDWKQEAVPAETLFLWEFTQYEFCRQWGEIKAYANQKGIRIIGDLPIYVAYDSADVWANRPLFCLDARNRPTAVAGVPPDYFCEDGQLWGNPLYRWEVMEQDGFAWWRERMQFTLELFDGVRMDHFRGFEAYYSIPAGEKTARNGTWIAGPGMKLINALRDICADKLMIAEDLGVITPEVQKLVQDSGFPGMRVLQFGFVGDGSNHLPHNYPAHSVAYTGTHDNNTLLGHVWELDDEARARLLAYFGWENQPQWDHCYPVILRQMLASHAGLVVFPVQDLLYFGRDTRLNTPGKSNGNWGWRLKQAQLDRIDRSLLRSWNRLYERG